MHEQQSSRSITSLLVDLSRESSELVRKEIELAKAETKEKAEQCTDGLMMILVGALVLVVGFFYLMEALVFGISEVLPPQYSPWLAALIVGVVAAFTGYFLYNKGRDKLELKHLKPNKTTESLRKDLHLVKGSLS